jgi:ubiquinone/menaquinone biosynthesis C-methylase UbiE
MHDQLPIIRDYELNDDARDFTYYFDDMNDVRRRIVRDLALRGDSSFLDIGTGDGWFPMAFQEVLRFGLVATIELAANEAANAQRRARKLADLRTQFLSMDAYQLGFADASFDIAGSFLAVQDICASVEDLTRLSSEVSRVLRPGGTFVIATITPEDAENDSQRLGIELYRFIRAGYFSKEELRSGLQPAGFKIDDFRFYYTGVDLSPQSAMQFIKFQCGWWVDTYQMPTVDWRTTWRRFGPRIEALNGVQVDSKITVVVARKAD